MNFLINGCAELMGKNVLVMGKNVLGFWKYNILSVGWLKSITSARLLLFSC